MALRAAPRATLRSVGRLLRWIGLAARAAFALVLLAGLLAGLPWGLAHYIGWPLPHAVPTWDQLAAGLTSHQVPDEVFLNALACVAWLLWAMLVASFPVELAAAVRDVPVPHLPVLGPAQALTGALIGALTLSLLTGRGAVFAAPATAAGTDPGARPAQTVATAPAHPGRTVQAVLPPARPEGATSGAVAFATAATVAPAVLDAAGTNTAGGTVAARPPAAHTLTYRVAAGDWLGFIAQRFLGDFGRYPDIAALNRDLIPDDDGPDGPDHIEPGWSLVLPADAHDRSPRRHATGHLITPPRPAPPQPAPERALHPTRPRRRHRRPPPHPRRGHRARPRHRPRRAFPLTRVLPPPHRTPPPRTSTGRTRPTPTPGWTCPAAGWASRWPRPWSPPGRRCGCAAGTATPPARRPAPRWRTPTWHRCHG